MESDQIKDIIDIMINKTHFLVYILIENLFIITPCDIHSSKRISVKAMEFL